MAVTKRIVCLANSRKLGGRCVAGKEFTRGRVGAWIRPVSVRQHGELSLPDRRYDDGNDPSVLDIMDVSLVKAIPKDYQQENWLLDSAQRWKKVGRATWTDVQQLTDPISPLWVNGHSTARGLNDEVPLQLAAGLSSSLRLVGVPNVILFVFTYYGNRRVQGRFRHAGTNYLLWVTDPRYEEPYKSKPDGDYTIGECALTLSISEPFAERQCCYKLIAAIMERSGRVTI